MGLLDREKGRNDSAVAAILGLNTVSDMTDDNLGFEKENNKEIVNVPIETLVPFKNHIFKRQSEEKINEIAETIKTNGICYPLIVRPLEDGGMEIISGHTRKLAAERVGLTEVPCIIKELNDDDANDIMVITNCQREGLLYSEKAWMYRIRMESAKRQGQRSEDGEKIDTAKEIGDLTGDSKRTVHRYIQLTYLIKEFMDLVDEKKIAAFPIGTDLSSLTEAEQHAVYNFIKVGGMKINKSQASKLKKEHDRLEKEGKILDDEIISDILIEEKKEKPKKVTLKNDVRQFFNEDATDDFIESKIIELLKEWKESMVD